MKKLVNPNFIYILTFTVPFVVYSLGWSTLYPLLQFNLVIFYAATFLFCLLAGVAIHKSGRFHYHDIPENPVNFLWLIFLYAFYALDILYSGYVPIIKFTGNTSYGGSINYGIPTVHVIMITFTLFYALYLFHQFISRKTFKLFFYYLLTMVPFIVLLQRSNIMYIIIGSFVIYILSLKKIPTSKILKVMGGGFFVLYMFGYAGNLRSSNGDSTFIPRMSGVTKEFLEGWVPNEFYWSYLYIASPVANLQNTINKEKEVRPDFKALFINEMIPDFIAKRLGEKFGAENRWFHQINPFLNVGTIYARPYSYVSWTGMAIVFLYLMVLMNLYYILLQKSWMYGVTGVAMMFNIIAIANFDNTLTVAAYGFSLIYPLLFSMIRSVRIDKLIRDHRYHPDLV